MSYSQKKSAMRAFTAATMTVTALWYMTQKDRYFDTEPVVEPEQVSETDDLSMTLNAPINNIRQIKSLPLQMAPAQGINFIAGLQREGYIETPQEKEVTGNDIYKEKVVEAWNYYTKKRHIPINLVQQIYLASERAGFDFPYLMKLADAESGLKCNSEAGTSTAVGCFQFTERTWLAYLHLKGREYGLDKIIDEIKAVPRDGYYDYVVNDPEMRQAILNLRTRPEIAGVMAAEYARENYKTLRQNYDGDIGRIEMKSAHVLGGHEAARFLTLKDKHPDQAARDYFPKAAQYNAGLFYKNGKPVSLAQLYNKFKKKMGGHNYYTPEPPRIHLAMAQTGPRSAARKP